MTEPPPDDSRVHDPEAQMRRALGLNDNRAGTTERDQAIWKPGDPHQARRRKFVRDGEVPVTMIHRDHRTEDESGNPLEAARQAIRSQAAGRERAEKALEQAQETVRQLQTSLGHERLAKNEAIERARSENRGLDLALTSVRAELLAEKIARERAEQALRDAQSIISNLSEKLHGSQRALQSSRAEFATERQKAMEATRAATAAPAADAPVGGDDQPMEPVRRPVGRPRKQVVAETLEKPDGGRAGLSRSTNRMKAPKKAGAHRQPRSKPVKWWLAGR